MDHLITNIKKPRWHPCVWCHSRRSLFTGWAVAWIQAKVICISKLLRSKMTKSLYQSNIHLYFRTRNHLRKFNNICQPIRIKNWTVALSRSSYRLLCIHIAQIRQSALTPAIFNVNARKHVYQTQHTALTQSQAHAERSSERKAKQTTSIINHVQLKVLLPQLTSTVFDKYMVLTFGN